MLEHAGGAPLEGTALSFPGDETLVLGLNVQSTGQGHASAFNPLLAERLGIKAERIEHRHGASAMEVAGYFPAGTRSRTTPSPRPTKNVEGMLSKSKTISAAPLASAGTPIPQRR